MARLPKPKIVIDELPKPNATAGGGSWPLKLDHVSAFAWHDSFFSESDLDALIEIGQSTNLTKAQTYGKQSDDVRNSFVSFLFPNDVTSWVFSKLTDLVTAMNEQHFGFDLTGFEQGLQFTRYTAPGEHYRWHSDRGFMSPTRKLSVSVQLSDPQSYKGGGLELNPDGVVAKVPKKRGMVTLFPSYTLHRVRPVTEGTRFSLVAWVSGPPFQ